ncbi:hypothetical protein MLD38_013550 [Melastoma candidum]|uniref:Uncharacterized protein n=1 Tax=Melastoma candidum TaxID=119954 RepID=A0ACB9RA10_9MYRT|nr:hypothetical protein MLD38_013550 [Melastoma candidum]
MGRVFFRKILLPDISFFLSFHERPDKTCSLTRSDPTHKPYHPPAAAAEDDHLLRQTLRRLISSSTPPLVRSVTYMPRPGDGAPRAVTLIPGDGIGPLVTDAVEQVMSAMHAPVYFERYEVHGDMKRVELNDILQIILGTNLNSYSYYSNGCVLR